MHQPQARFQLLRHARVLIRASPVAYSWRSATIGSTLVAQRAGT
jgi:hypothetical protein